MPKEYISRFPPCPAYHVSQFQSWLEDMAMDGWFLDQDPFFAGFAGFHRSESKTVRYRLQPAPKKAGIFARRDRQQEAIDLAREYGWTYLGNHMDFFIFFTDDPAVPELNTDPHVEALALEEFRKCKRSNFISQLILIAFYTGLFFWIGPISFFLSMPLWFPVILICVAAVNMYLGWKELHHLQLLQQKLSAGDNLPSNSDWRSSKNLHWLTALFSSLLVILLIFSYIDSRLFNWEDRRWQLRAEELPFATAEDLYPGSTFVPDEPWIIEEVDHVAERSTPLAERQIILGQHGSFLPEKHDLYLRVEYYDMRSEWLAKSLYRELRHQARLSKYYEARTVTDLPTAQECAWQDIVTTFALLQNGDKVIQIRLSQYDDPAMPLDTWAAIFANSILP